MVRHDSFESGSAPWVEAALGAARPETFDGATGLPFERIAGFRPDLIVATDDYFLYGFDGLIRAVVGEDASLTLLQQLGLTMAPDVAGLPQTRPGRATFPGVQDRSEA